MQQNAKPKQVKIIPQQITTNANVKDPSGANKRLKQKQKIRMKITKFFSQGVKERVLTEERRRKNNYNKIKINSIATQTEKVQSKRKRHDIKVD